LYDYVHSDPTSNEFFSFRAGDRFTILLNSKDLQGWTIVLDSKNQKGFVPGNYLQIITNEDKSLKRKASGGVKLNTKTLIKEKTSGSDSKTGHIAKPKISTSKANNYSKIPDPNKKQPKK